MAGSSQLVSSVNDVITCPICMDHYTDPRSLPCVHTFCLSCLQKNFTNKQPGNAVSCPMCRTDFTIPGVGLQGLPKNFIVGGLVSSIKMQDLKLQPDEEAEEEAVEVAAVQIADQSYGSSEEASAEVDMNQDEVQDIESIKSHVEEYTKICETRGTGGYLQYLIEKLESWKKQPLNIAVIGNSGVGKSSFINAIRDLFADDEGAAETDVAEATMEITAYSHPANKLLKFWDLPGVGTDKFPKDKYLEQMEIDRFDFFLLMTASRFTQNDTWLGQEIQKRGKKFYCVRTKIGVDVSSEKMKRRRSKSFNQDELLTRVRNDIRDHLKGMGSRRSKVFLVDNLEKNKFDFSKLEQSLIQGFPDLKRQALILSMSCFSAEMVRMKAAQLRKRISLVSWQIIIVPWSRSRATVNRKIIEQSEFYFRQFGLDDESLTTHAKVTNSSPEDLQKIVKANFPPEFFTVDGLKTFIQSLGSDSHVVVNINFIQRIAIAIGSLMSARSFDSKLRILRSIVNKMEKVALEVVDYAAEHGDDDDDDDSD